MKKLRSLNYIFKKNATFEYFNNYSEFNGLFKGPLKAEYRVLFSLSVPGNFSKMLQNGDFYIFLASIVDHLSTQPRVQFYF